MKLILLPGLDGTGELFAPLVAHLGADIETRVVAYPPDGSQRYTDLLEYVRASLPVDEPFVLLGWSFSGPLALMIAAEHPENFRGVILCASFQSNPRPLARWLMPVTQPWLFRLFPMPGSAAFPCSTLPGAGIGWFRGAMRMPSRSTRASFGSKGPIW